MVKGSSDREEVVLLLCLAKTGFNDGSQIHVGILQAVYTAYTGRCGYIDDIVYIIDHTDNTASSAHKLQK